MADGRLIEAELVEEVDPTDLEQVFFHPTNLSEAKHKRVVADLDRLVREALNNRGDLDSQLAHWNDMAEGIATPKNFPWPDSSNLFIPIPEIHLNNVHASGRQTLLKGDNLYYVRSIGVVGDFNQANRLERYVNFKAMVELPMVDRFSQLMWCAERDGTALAQVQWKEEKDIVKRLVDYPTAADFTSTYPTPEAAGLSKKQYAKVMAKFQKGIKVTLMETRMETIFKGPTVDVVQLADFLMAPMTAIMTKYASLVGKIFTMSESELYANEENAGWYDVKKVIDSKEDGRKDIGTSLKDDIEGITRRQGKGEFVMVDGIHRIDLDGDGIDERYLFVFHPFTRTLVFYMDYPYLHGKDCFIPVRLKKRPGRFLGRGLCQMLDDISSEINTQHNQRVDSRTVTTVPTFKALASAKKDFDPSRSDQRFIPGRVFWLTNLSDVQQFDIRPTDMGESMQEESNLMQLADQMTGASQLRSGRETKSDPRAPAAKVMQLLNQSNIRLDDYFEEMAGCAQDNEGFNAIGEMLLELYYQFLDEDLAKIPVLKSSNQQPELDEQGKPKTITMSRNDFYIRNKFKVQMAKTSASMNPDAMLMKYMQVYSLLVNDPLVGGRPAGRLNLDRKLLSLAREENPDLFLPKDENEAAQVMMQAALAAQAGAQGGEGKGHARTRGGQTKARTPGAPGTTRPLG